MVRPAMSRTLNVNRDAFSSGQIGSKIWLCEELEKVYSQINCLGIYGGWYGITHFLLKVRGNIQIDRCVSLDLDPKCQPVADMINELWVWQDWQFKAFTEDCSKSTVLLRDIDLVINTSTEHFDSMDWWNNIPKGTAVALQGNNMPHEDHHIHSSCLRDFMETYPLSESSYSGEKEFVYPDWRFTRFMVIGTK